MNVRIVKAVTSVRVGEGSSVSAMNLPVARERHTRWPFIPGSSLKGALRSRAVSSRCDLDDEVAVFGARPPISKREAGEDDQPGDAMDVNESIGSLRVLQATLLALPVRALVSTFALVTCPTALARFARAARIDVDLPNPRVGDACIGEGLEERMAAQHPTSMGGAAFQGVVFLEDLDLAACASPMVSRWAERLAEWTGDMSPLEHLVIVHDDVFAHACATWTEFRTRNRVSEETGVVEDGALFTVELIAPEALWWTITAGDDRGLLPDDADTFTLGGHASVGSGRVCWSRRRR